MADRRRVLRGTTDAQLDRAAEIQPEDEGRDGPGGRAWREHARPEFRDLLDAPPLERP